MYMHQYFFRHESDEIEEHIIGNYFVKNRLYRTVTDAKYICINQIYILSTKNIVKVI